MAAGREGSSKINVLKILGKGVNEIKMIFLPLSGS